MCVCELESHKYQGCIYHSYKMWAKVPKENLQRWLRVWQEDEGEEENSKPKRAFIGGNKNTEFRSFSVFKFHMSVPSILLQSFQNLWKNIPHLLYFVFYEMGKTPSATIVKTEENEPF